MTLSIDFDPLEPSPNTEDSGGFRKASPAACIQQQEQMNSEKPQWNLDVETAQRECRVCFAKWQALTSRIRKMVEEHEEYAPEAFKASILELLPDYQRAANAALARPTRAHLTPECPERNVGQPPKTLCEPR